MWAFALVLPVASLQRLRREHLATGPVPGWLALNGLPVAQSSTAEGGDAARAVDGNADPLWTGNSCTQTNSELNPWWALTLPVTTKIAAVRVTNRGDCCGERLSGFTVMVGTTACAQNVSIAQGQTVDVICTAVGNQVSILVEREDVLSICEIGILAAPFQPALLPWKYVHLTGLPTAQSSPGDGSASRAIDGDASSVWDNGSCSRTERQESPWWSVTLPGPKVIAAVRVTSGEAMSGFSVLVDGVACAQNVTAQTTTDVACPAFGSVVSIALPREDALTICEVEVVATDAPIHLNEPSPDLPAIEMPPP